MFSAPYDQLLNSNLRSLTATEPETDAFIQLCALYPITHDYVELMNVITNQSQMSSALAD